MRRGTAKAIMVAGLTIGLLGYSLKGTSQIASINTATSVAGLLKKEKKKPKLATYQVIWERNNGNEIDAGKVHIRENSVEAGLKPLFSILFYQPDDSTFIEKTKTLGNVETYLYKKIVHNNDTVWQFVDYHGSPIHRKKKAVAEGLIYPPGTTMQLENIVNLFQGIVADTTKTFVMEDQYVLPILTDSTTTVMPDQYFTEEDISDGRYLKVDFIDLDGEKNNHIYIDHPAEGTIVNVVQGEKTISLPQKAKILLTSPREIRHFRLEPVLLNIEGMIEAYGRNKDESVIRQDE